MPSSLTCPEEAKLLPPCSVPARRSRWPCRSVASPTTCSAAMTTPRRADPDVQGRIPHVPVRRGLRRDPGLSPQGDARSDRAAHERERDSPPGIRRCAGGLERQDRENQLSGIGIALEARLSDVRCSRSLDTVCGGRPGSRDCLNDCCPATAARTHHVLQSRRRARLQSRARI